MKKLNKIEETTGKSFTVCAALNARHDEIYAALNTNNIAFARSTALDCLEDPRITDIVAVEKAKKIFATRNTNNFLSCLMTYMTCVKVS